MAVDRDVILGLGLGLRTHGLGLVIKVLALTSRPRPGQTKCYRFIITRINADKFDPDIFSTVYTQ